MIRKSIQDVYVTLHALPNSLPNYIIDHSYRQAVWRGRIIVFLSLIRKECISATCVLGSTNRKSSWVNIDSRNDRYQWRSHCQKRRALSCLKETHASPQLPRRGQALDQIALSTLTPTMVTREPIILKALIKYQNPRWVPGETITWTVMKTYRRSQLPLVNSALEIERQSVCFGSLDEMYPKLILWPDFSIRCITLLRPVFLL